MTKFNEKIVKSILKDDNKYKKIYVIVNYNCYSACVWTVNFLSLFPNVVILGKEIGLTTGTGNPLKFDLPSKMAALHLP